MMLPQGLSDNSLYQNMWQSINRALPMIYKDSVLVKLDYTYTTTYKYSANSVDFVFIQIVLVDQGWQVCVWTTKKSIISAPSSVISCHFSPPSLPLFSWVKLSQVSTAALWPFGGVSVFPQTLLWQPFVCFYALLQAPPRSKYSTCT